MEENCMSTKLRRLGMAKVMSTEDMFDAVDRSQ